MKKFFVRRVLPVFMAAVMAFSVCIVPGKAVAAGTIMTIIELIGSANDIKQFAEDLFSYFNRTDSDDWGEWWCSSYEAATRTHAFYMRETLSDLAFDWNQNYRQVYHGIMADVQPIGDQGYEYVVLQSAYDPDNPNFSRVVLTHADGRPIAYDPSMDEDAADPVVPGSDIYNWWIPEDDFEAPFRMLSLEDLSNLATDAGADLAWNDTYYYIYRDDGNLVYADSAGHPYAAFRNLDQFASQTERPGTSAEDENGEDVELPEDFDANIDLENMLITLPNGTLAVLDSVIYDESTKSYYIDSHDTYNTTNNYYYHWEYHINYTSITYIGQTEEYNKYYEVYYELPDGRDSADLTKEEVEQLNTSVDVIPYGRSTDDTSLRSLYHFDGDTEDASYWNYCTDFTWNTGASLTYMDAAVFEGALYLDENIHDFTLTIPSEIGNDDFTIQFRYYQSYTAAPQTDSYIQSGLYKLLQLSGGYYVDPAGTTLAVTPTGTWNEVAIMRDSGTLYFYNNGVCIGSYTDSSYLNNQITFHFGSSQQTYKYLDELRILNYALESGGDSYTPTSVPHDTNLALVLPDSVLPVADEYWEVNFSEGAELSTDFTDNATSDYFSVSASKYMSFQTGKEGIALMYDVAEIPSGKYEDFDDFGPTVSTMPPTFEFNASSVGIEKSEDNKYYGVSANVVLGDGNQYSLRYAFYNDFNSTQYDENLNEVEAMHCQLVNIPNGYLSGYNGVIYIIINPRVSGTVVRAISVAITGPFSSRSSITWEDTSISCEKVSSVTPMTPDQMNTPTLSVRTDLDITSYQIGGVRPSVPEKGMVWALVENERITSIQVYNGQAWEGVDGRIWTGSRWIPASSYNIITLKDMYDIVDATQDYEYIYSESGFWAWWQRTWNSFTERLFGLLETIANPAPATETVRVKKTITWDGNIEGLVSLDGMGYKVSDEIITVDQLVGGVLTDSSGNKCFLVDSMIQSNGSMSAFPMDSEGNFLALPVILLYAPFSISDTVSCPPGVYFEKSDSVYIASLTYYVEETVVVGGSGTSGADGGSGSDVMDDVDLDAEDAVADPEQEDGKSLWQFIVLVIAGGKSVVSGVRHMFSGIVSTVPDTMDDITGAFDPGGMAVGFLDGSSMDPDAADLGDVELSGSEEVDPWRYR